MVVELNNRSKTIVDLKDVQECIPEVSGGIRHQFYWINFYFKSGSTLTVSYADKEEYCFSDAEFMNEVISALKPSK
mgnify:CR=1 FL=1